MQTKIDLLEESDADLSNFIVNDSKSPNKSSSFKLK